jgi:prepilin-type N-terminal cleavage/methylation domain-containing protein
MGILSNRDTRAYGFTIVELLIVIVVIGILAAVTIVAYAGITTQANKTAAQSTAQQDSKKIALYMTQNSDNVPPDLGSAGITSTTGATYTPNTTTTPQTYCLTITVSGQSYYVDNSGHSTPVSGTCPISSAIATAAGASPLAVLAGASGSTGLADGALASGFTIYLYADVTSPGICTYGFDLGTGSNEEQFNTACIPFSSHVANGNQLYGYFGNPGYGVPMQGPSLLAFAQSSSARYIRAPGTLQNSNSDGFTITSAPTFATSTNQYITYQPFTREWIFAGVHSQATSEAVLAAIASDSTGANGRPVLSAATPNMVDTTYTSLPVSVSATINYATPSVTSVQWQRSPTQNGPWADISGATSTIYSVTSATYPQYGDQYYRLKATNSKGTTYSAFSQFSYSGGGG